MKKEITKEMTEEQIENWRKILLLSVGSYALIMPKEEIQQIRYNMQKHVNQNCNYK